MNKPSRVVRYNVAAAFSALFLLAAPAAQAQLISPFGKDVIALEPEDLAELRGAVAKVLNEYKVGTVESWSSSKTNRAGEAVLTNTYERNGLKCAQVTHRFTSGGGHTFSAPMCQIADGSWKLAF